jgi:hypothetical protein
MRTIFQNLVGAAALLASAVCLAQQAPVIVKSEAPKEGVSTLNLQSSQGSACTTPTVGLCGMCAISCPTGKAAVCKPGMSVGGGAPASSCVQPPECKCQ